MGFFFKKIIVVYVFLTGEYLSLFLSLSLYMCIYLTKIKNQKEKRSANLTPTHQGSSKGGQSKCKKTGYFFLFTFLFPPPFYKVEKDGFNCIPLANNTYAL